MHYVRNDTGSAFTYPLHIGSALARNQVTLAKAPTVNILDDATFERLAGRQDAAGTWRGGSASDYFNGQRLVQVGRPPAKDPTHVVEIKSGVTETAQSRRARERERAVSSTADLAAQNAELISLLQRQGMDPRVRAAEDEVRLLEAQARKAKAEAEIAEADARKAAASVPMDTAFDPTKHTVEEVRELVQAASLDEILSAIRIEKARPNGPRKGALDALTEALKG